MGDMIDRNAAIAKCRAIADEAKSYGMPQMAMGGYASAEAIAALPAAPAEDAEQEASRLPDLGAREASLREAAQCAIDNQDCSPWEISEAILNLIGKKPAGPYPAALTDGGSDG